MVKTKKILPVLMIGVVIIIFASLIVTKISNKQSVEKNKLTDPSREILTIVEPPDKKPLTPSENIAAQKMSKNPLVGKEIAKNDTQEIVEGKDKALPQQAVKPEEAAKPASPVTPVKVEQQPSSNNKTPEADVEKAQPTIKTDAPVEAKPVQKPKLKAAHKDTETKHPVTAVKAVQKPTKLTHSTKPAIIDRGKEQAVAHANATTPHKKIAAPTSPKPLKASAAKDKAAASTPITSKPESNSSQAYCVQVGLFSNSANALSLLNKLQANNHQGVIKEIHKKNKTLYRVSTGKFNTMKEAKAVALQLKTVNKIDAIVVK
jgi:cell division protein FtsN